MRTELLDNSCIAFDLIESEMPSVMNIVETRLHRNYTLEMFVKAILKSRDYDHGFFIVGEHKLYYQDGQLEHDIPESIKDGYVQCVSGVTGFLMADYKISLISSDIEDDRKPAKDLIDMAKMMGEEMRQIVCKYENMIGERIHSVNVKREAVYPTFSMNKNNAGYGFEFEV